MIAIFRPSGDQSKSRMSSDLKSVIWWPGVPSSGCSHKLSALPVRTLYTTAFPSRAKRIRLSGNALSRGLSSSSSFGVWAASSDTTANFSLGSPRRYELKAASLASGEAAIRLKTAYSETFCEAPPSKQVAFAFGYIDCDKTGKSITRLLDWADNHFSIGGPGGINQSLG